MNLTVLESKFKNLYHDDADDDDDSSHESSDGQCRLIMIMIMIMQMMLKMMLMMKMMMMMTMRMKTCPSPCGCSFAKELHEATLHHQPEAARHVEKHGQEYQVKRHPLKIDNFSLNYINKYIFVILEISI